MHLVNFSWFCNQRNLVDFFNKNQDKLTNLYLQTRIYGKPVNNFLFLYYVVLFYKFFLFTLPGKSFWSLGKMKKSIKNK